MVEANRYQAGFLDQVLVLDIQEVERRHRETSRYADPDLVFYEADVHVRSQNAGIPDLVGAHFPRLGIIKPDLAEGRKPAWIWRPRNLGSAITFLNRVAEVLELQQQPAKEVLEFIKQKQRRLKRGGRGWSVSIDRMEEEGEMFNHFRDISSTPITGDVKLDDEYLAGMWDAKKGGLGIFRTERAPLRPKIHVSHKTVHSGLIEALIDRYPNSKSYETSRRSKLYGVNSIEWHAYGLEALNLLQDIRSYAFLNSEVVNMLIDYQIRQSTFDEELNRYRIGGQTATTNPDSKLVNRVLWHKVRALNKFARLTRGD